jgi:hypothetical protein
VLYAFKNPVNINDLQKNDALFREWRAYSGNFQGRSFGIPITHWNRLNQIAVTKDLKYKIFLIILIYILTIIINN